VFFFLLFHGGHLHLQLRQCFIHLALLGGFWQVFGLFAFLGVNLRVPLYVTIVALVVILLTTMAFFFVASITKGMVFKKCYAVIKHSLCGINRY
jgi:hypothetical protein